ncbi:MAG: helix-turn-helix transcriptional regulator [Ardenticatenaceae bacterium]|nr:helix-turn-helix transcriptional regulator [Ardenticatenaceae bacterium]
MAEPLEPHDYGDCINDVKQYIHNHTNKPLNREVLATIAGFSIPHFHRIFTAEVGENIATYVRRVRLERAGRKLRMGAVDITEVALAAGYDSHAAFSKAFKQHFGLTPSDFRQLDCWSATQILRKDKTKDED